jgi:thiol-disulfide isomerase/thioredoxin
MKRLASILVIAASCLSPAFSVGDVLRESSGQRRATLDAMELQAFPPVWENLSTWANGDPVKAADLSGKPALVVNWASWKEASVRALPLAQRMADKFGAQGLVVVGIHHPQGWDAAEKTAKDRGAKFAIAHDKDSGYRKALKIDHDPEYFIIDRAGHLRYASVAAGSVEEALAEVVGETAAAAGDVPKIRKDRDEQARLAGRRTAGIGTEFDLSTLPPVPPGYAQPSEQAYKDVKWPKVEKELGKTFGLLDQDGKALEPKLAFAPTIWHPRKPESTGRLQVIYFWHPEVHVSYSTAMPQMDRLQEQHLRDLAVVGALIGEKVLDPEKANQQQSEEENFEKLKKKYEGFIASRRYSHALAVDLPATCLQSLTNQSGQRNFPVPGAMIVSTDGTIRWMGWINSSDFRSALDRMLANDPGVQKRRKLDDDYIATHKK